MEMLSENARLDQRVVGFSALCEVTKILSEQIDLAQGLTAALRVLSAFMGMTKGTVCFYDPARRELGIKAAFGLTGEERRRSRHRIEDGIAGQVMKLGLPMVVPDLGKEPHLLNKTRARRARELQGITFLCVPIRIRGEILGVLSVERPAHDVRASAEDDLRVLTIVASLIGHAVRLREEQARNLHALDDWKGLRELERELVMRALQEAGGIQVKAAARLGITPRQFAYKMKQYRIIKEFRIKD